ncbi:unnamed protein product [Didymodactylos carnosus]|uniref:Kinesin light chain n=1 Tax=Didymodactylos carnosus TaxID=1234261 RepID=A0A8S2RR20_9BILA|nr:unnamed protein product [Didymodactylos carnosus]CAF4175484.1 unnamed protein product [Didymodactylos carnosus]
MIEICRRYYRGNPKQLKLIDEFELEYKPQHAIRWYTRQSFIYKLINKALCTEDIQQLYTFRFFIIDLCTSIKREAMAEQRRIILYRGLKLSNDELKKLIQNRGNFISINGFLSTSRSKEVARMFTTTSDRLSTEIGVLYEIVCDLNELNGSTNFADISKHSDFPDEEVLFDLETTFQILSVDQIENENIHLIKLKATSEGLEFVQDYNALYREQVKEKTVRVAFGDLLIETGRYDQAQLYFENLYKNSPSEDVAIILSNIGLCHDYKCEYENALKYYNASCQILVSSDPPRAKELARVLNNIGLVLQDTDQYNQALEFLMKSLHIQKKHVQHEHRYVAQTLNNIGVIYYIRQEYDLALEYNKKSLTLQEKLLSSNHIDIAQTLNSLGLIYQDKSDNLTALEYHVRSLDIKENYLPPNHIKTAQTLNHVGQIYWTKGEYNYALRYHLRSLKMQQECLPSVHIIRAYTLDYIGLVYYSKKDFDFAL